MALISDNDSVVGLRLSYDLPDSAIEITKQLAQSTEMLRTNLEFIARYSKESKEYMAELPEIQRQMQLIQQDQVRVLEQTAVAEERIANARERSGSASGSPVISTETRSPQRGATPREQDILDQSNTESRQAQRGMAPSVSSGGRAPSSSSDDNTATKELARQRSIEREENAKKELEARASAESGSWSRQLSSLKGNIGAGIGVMNARDIGGAIKGGEGLLKGLGGAGGALAGAAGAIPYVAAAGAVVEGASQLNDQYQQYRTLGMTTGGGVSQGIGYDMAIKTMALNPFIGTDQARQIVMGALNQGYTGKEFDTVTDFMATNLKDMNLQVADSMKLLQSNVNLGGQSIASLNDQLQALRGLASNSNTSQAQMQSQFVQANAAGTAAGMSGVASGQQALLLSDLFQNQDGKTNPLKGKGMSDIGTAAFNPQMEALVANARGKNEKYWQVPDLASSEGADVYMNEVQSVLQGYAAKGWDAHQFNAVLGTFGMQMSDAEAGSLQKQLLQPGSIVGPAEKAIKAQNTPRKVSGGEKFGRETSGLGGVVGEAARGVLWDAPASAFKNLWGAVTGNGINTGREGLDKTKKALSSDLANNDSDQSYGHGNYSSEALDQLASQYGMDNVWLDENGKRTKLSDLDYRDKKTFDRIDSGKIVTSAKGGTPQDLSSFMSSGGDASSQQAGLYSGSVTVGLTSEAAKALKVVSTTGNVYAGSAQALSAYNGVTFNDVPPGQ